jgi:outer membrane protein OmpA-like peptidoglycan-associated protein
LFIFSASLLPAQTARELDLLLETRQISFSQASRFVLVVARVLNEETAGTAYTLARERGWLPKRAAPDNPIRLGELCHLIMRAFEMKGSFLYAIFPGPRYAFRELDYLGLIPGQRDPSVRVSGERFLHILSLVAAHTGVDEKAAEEEARLAAEEEARRQAEAEEARRQAEEEEARRLAEEEEARRLAEEEEARRLAEEDEARRQAEEEEARRLAEEEEARRQAEEEEARRLAEEEEARRLAEEEALRLAAEEEARRLSAGGLPPAGKEENLRLAEEEEARRLAAKEALLLADGEVRRLVEQETRREVEEEARRLAAEEALLLAEEEVRRLVERETLRQAREEGEEEAEREARRALADAALVQSLRIRFAADGTELTEAERAKIREIVPILLRYPDKKLLVTGYTALAAAEAGRLRISTGRAQAVADYLISLNVRRPGDIQVQGHGAQRPLGSNDTAAGRALNRRVEITLLDE